MFCFNSLAGLLFENWTNDSFRDTVQVSCATCVEFLAEKINSVIRGLLCVGIGCRSLEGAIWVSGDLAPASGFITGECATSTAMLISAFLTDKTLTLFR